VKKIVTTKGFRHRSLQDGAAAVSKTEKGATPLEFLTAGGKGILRKGKEDRETQQEVRFGKEQEEGEG